MFLGIDHLLIAVADPDDAAAQLEADLGLEATGGGRHDVLGTFNRLVWLGDAYLELIGVFNRALAERSWLGPAVLRKLDEGGGFATWAIATDALAADLAGLRDAGSDLGDPVAGERRRADGAVVRWRLAATRLLGPSEPPFLIEHDPASAEWTSADRAARAALPHPIGGPVRLDVLELPVDDVPRTVQRFGLGAVIFDVPLALAAFVGGLAITRARWRPRRAAGSLPFRAVSTVLIRLVPVGDAGVASAG